jgi:hypothetical protein
MDPPVSPGCVKRAFSLKASGEYPTERVLVSYPHGRTLALAADIDWACDDMVGARGTGYQLVGDTDLSVVGFEPADVLSLLPGTPAPDLIGASLQSVRPRVSVDGEIPGSGPPWRIVFTSPPPGEPTSGIVDVLVSAPTVAPCRAHQLAATVLPGQAGTGMVFATVTIVDTSPRACRLTGPITVSALDSAGQPYAREPFPVEGTGRFPLVLQPRASQRGQNRELEAQTLLEDPVFPGSCPRGWSLPSGWTLALPDGGTVDAADPNRRSRDNITVCDGQFAQGTIALAKWAP